VTITKGTFSAKPLLCRECGKRLTGVIMTDWGFMLCDHCAVKAFDAYMAKSLKSNDLQADKPRVTPRYDGPDTQPCVGLNDWD